MVGSFQGEQKILVKWDEQISHAATAFAYPSAFRSSEGAFYRVVREVAVGHSSVEKNEEIAITIVLHVAQPDAEHIATDGVVDVDIEGNSVFLPPFGFWNDCALVEGIAGTGRKSQCQNNNQSNNAEC